MKKLKLESLEFNPPEILSRMQLKHVMGGDDGSGSGSSTSGSSKGGSTDCTNPCPGYIGRGTITHQCDPCGLDKERTTGDTAMCCL